MHGFPTVSMERQCNPAEPTCQSATPPSPLSCQDTDCKQEGPPCRIRSLVACWLSCCLQWSPHVGPLLNGTCAGHRALANSRDQRRRTTGTCARAVGLSAGRLSTSETVSLKGVGLGRCRPADRHGKTKVGSAKKATKREIEQGYDCRAPQRVPRWHRHAAWTASTHLRCVRPPSPHSLPLLAPACVPHAVAGKLGGDEVHLIDRRVDPDVGRVHLLTWRDAWREAPRVS